MADWLSVLGWDLLGCTVLAAAPAQRPAATPRETYLWYLAFALLSCAIIVGIVVATRLWREIHEDEAPATNEEILEEFRQAFAQGEIDEAEFRRLTALLTDPAGNRACDPVAKPKRPSDPDLSAREPAENADEPGAAPDD